MDLVNDRLLQTGQLDEVADFIEYHPATAGLYTAARKVREVRWKIRGQDSSKLKHGARIKFDNAHATVEFRLNEWLSSVLMLMIQELTNVSNCDRLKALSQSTKALKRDGRTNGLKEQYVKTVEFIEYEAYKNRVAMGNALNVSQPLPKNGDWNTLNKRNPGDALYNNFDNYFADLTADHKGFVAKQYKSL